MSGTSAPWHAEARRAEFEATRRGREIEFSEWVRLDLEYIDNWSLALDMRIAALTVPVVLFGRGSV